jgi:centromere protein C
LIENISERDAKLFFTQARKIAPTAEELNAFGAVATPRRHSSGAATAAGVDSGADAGTRQSSGPRSSTVAPTTQLDGTGGRGMSKMPTAKRAVSTKV